MQYNTKNAMQKIQSNAIQYNTTFKQLPGNVEQCNETQDNAIQCNTMQCNAM